MVELDLFNGHMRLLRWFLRGTWPLFLGVCSTTRGNKFEKGNGTLHGGEVYDAELQGAAAAIQAAFLVRRTGERIFVLLDNQAAIGALQTARTSSSKNLTQKVPKITLEAQVEVRWVPEHTNFPGNKEANAEARTALSRQPYREC